MLNIYVIMFLVVGIIPRAWAADLNRNPWQNESQIEEGHPNFIVDSIGNVIGIPSKVILLNPKMDRHKIGPETKAMLTQYIRDNPESLNDTKVRFNQFAPLGEFKRLIKNKKIHWWWRVFPGIPATVLSLGGRLLGGDQYNPYTDTINIYSDIPMVALHEAGHAMDTTKHYKEGNADYYILGRFLTPIELNQEYEASEAAMKYVKEKRDRKNEKAGYKTLYPAFGTYMGEETGVPFGNVFGAAAGHILGFTERKNREMAFTAYDKAVWSDEVVMNLKSDPVNKNLLDEDAERNRLLNAAWGK